MRSISFYDAEHAHHVVHMAVSRTKHNSKLSKLISDSTATINSMYITSPKSRGYDGSESDDDLEIHDDEYVTERSMQEHLDYENAIARSAQEAVEESQEKSQKILPTATTSTQLAVIPEDKMPGGTTLTQQEIEDGWIEVEKENSLGSAKNSFPGGRNMTSLEAHKAKNHVGFHPKCEECKRVRATQTRVSPLRLRLIHPTMYILPLGFLRFVCAWRRVTPSPGIL
mgnify:CR=1 FL=1